MNLNLGDRTVRIIFGAILAAVVAVVAYLGSPDVAVIPEQLALLIAAAIAGIGGYMQVRPNEAP